MAIKILITLEGSEQVKSAIDGIAQRGEDMMRGFQDLGTGITPLDNFSKGFEKLIPAFESGTQVSHGFAESLRVVIPALRLAGVEVGNFSGFSRLASAGLAGLAAAITGAVMVALANLEDAARKTKGTLDDLFGSKNLGGEAFKELQDAAKELGTTVADLAPGFESLTQAWNRFVESTRTFKFVAPKGEDLLPSLGGTTTIIGSVENLGKAYANFIKILRAGRLDQDAATKTADAFFKSISEGGKITEQSLRTLPTGTVELLAQAWGRGTINAEQFIREVRLAPLPLDQLLERMGRFGPQSDEAFGTRAIKTYKDELSALINTLQESFLKLSGTTFSDSLTNFLKEIRTNIRFITEDVQTLIRLWHEFQALTGKAPEPPPPPEPKLPTGTEEIKKTFRDVPEAWRKDVLDPITSETKQTFNTIGIDIANAPFLTKIDPKVKEEQRKILEDWKTGIEKVEPFDFKSITDSWQKLFDFIKEGMKGAIIAPAGAAEFTPGPLLQQQQLQQQQQGQTQPIVAPFQEADNQIRTIWIALMDYISTSVTEINFSPITQALVQPFTDALPFIRDALLQVENMIREIVRQALEAGQIIQQLNQGGRPNGSGGPGFIEIASGGFIRGPGTTTSDSIPAWLSNREYVIQARAVDHYGPNLFAALNSMRLPKDLFSHFAIGGLASALARSMPRYATGGLAAASAGRSLTIVLDGQSFGLNGSTDVVDQFERVATRVGIAQIGRPPGWVR